MISVQNALGHIRSVTHAPKSEAVPIGAALGRILAKDVSALIDMPPFITANMDGYAVSTCKAGDSLTVIGESAAGRAFEGSVAPGTAVRVSTGAVMPEGADRVLIQENTHWTDGEISVLRTPENENHVRHAGSDFSAGTNLLSSGHRLRAADLTLLAAAGYAELSVTRNLKVATFSSGDELQTPGTDLQTGNIYAANSIGLKSLLDSWGADVFDFGIVTDKPEAVDRLLPQLTDFDLIVPIGGASVGDHDHMRPAFARAGYDFFFNSVAIRPGKPSWLARKDNQNVLGLPGNPASAFVCAQIFLRPILGLKTSVFQAKLGTPLEENGPRETYLRAIASVKNGQIQIFPGHAQDSFRLRPQSSANALVCVPPMSGPFQIGDLLDVILLDELIAVK